MARTAWEKKKVNHNFSDLKSVVIKNVTSLPTLHPQLAEKWYPKNLPKLESRLFSLVKERHLCRKQPLMGNHSLKETVGGSCMHYAAFHRKYFQS